MSKALEALEHIYYGSQGYGDTDKYYKYLKEYLESIDNAEPSEALKCLNCLERLHDCGVFNYEEMEDYNIIKNYILKAQEPKQYVDELKLVEKKLKALEIIKEKNVNMFGFKRDIKQLGNRFTYKYYQSNLGNYHSGFDIQKLTEEEFNLLKEVLE